MKKHFLLLAFILICATLTAQPFFETAAKWCYTDGAFNQLGGPDFVFSNAYSYESDTVIAGRNCQKINGYFPDFNSTANYAMISNESGKVAIYNHFINDFTTIYDFNLSAQDTYITYLRECPLKFIVDTAYTTFYLGKTRRALKVHCYTFFINYQGVIYEGIGSTSAFVPVSNFGSWCEPMPDGNYEISLNVYSDAVVGTAVLVAGSECGGTGIASNDFTTFEFAIAPNPVYDYLNVSCGEALALLQLFDAQGKLIETPAVLNNKIPITDLDKGLFIVKCTTVSGKTASKRCVIR
jgi:hypothetical protein